MYGVATYIPSGVGSISGTSVASGELCAARELMMKQKAHGHYNMHWKLGWWSIIYKGSKSTPSLAIQM